MIYRLDTLLNLDFLVAIPLQGDDFKCLLWTLKLVGVEERGHS
jgi:hypothetical protein